MQSQPIKEENKRVKQRKRLWQRSTYVTILVDSTIITRPLITSYLANLFNTHTLNATTGHFSLPIQVPSYFFHGYTMYLFITYGWCVNVTERRGKKKARYFKVNETNTSTRVQKFSTHTSQTFYSQETNTHSHREWERM